jgi:hypothetical protein
VRVWLTVVGKAEGVAGGSEHAERGLGCELGQCAKIDGIVLILSGHRVSILIGPRQALTFGELALWTRSPSQGGT